MRRLALSLAASCGIAVLSACSGGTGVNSSTTVSPTSIVFTNGSGGVNDFFVALNGSAPVLVTATAVHGSSTAPVVIPDVQFTWSAKYAPTGTPYVTGGSPNGNSECGAPATTTGINSLLQQGPGGNPSVYGGYSQLTEQPNSNPPNYVQLAPQIFVGPPLQPSGADPSVDISPTPVQPATAGGTYCLILTATAQPSGVHGSVVVVVKP
jgi:hypothetical protein